MAFENILSQQRVKNFFEKAIAGGRLSHAYLFLGPPGAGQEAMALAVAELCLRRADQAAARDHRVANLTHPDVGVIFPSPVKLDDEDRRKVFDSLVQHPYLRLQPWANPSISIERIRELRRKAAFKSFEGKGRVVIILDCERMTVEAANSLLKILEEPPDGMYLIMTSSRPNLLLPTITSRCQMVKFDPLPADVICDALVAREKLDESKARLFSKLANGNYRTALEMSADGAQELQGQALQFFRNTIQPGFNQLCYIDKLLDEYQRDDKRLRELLAHVLIWFRDALVFRETGAAAQDKLVHFDEVTVLKNFNSSFPEADLHAATQEIEKSLELMDRHVQTNLVLIVLLNKLRAHVRRI